MTTRSDLERIGRMEEAVWGPQLAGRRPQRELAVDPTALTIVVAETDQQAGEVVSAGWIRYIRGTSSPRCGAVRRCRTGG